MKIVIRNKNGEIVTTYDDVLEISWLDDGSRGKRLLIYVPGDVMRRKLVATIYNVDFFALEVIHEQ